MHVAYYGGGRMHNPPIWTALGQSRAGRPESLRSLAEPALDCPRAGYMGGLCLPIDIEVWDPCYLTNKMFKIFDFVVAFRI